MCKPVHANLHFGLSPSPSRPDTKQGCFPLGFSSPDDFTRAHREVCSEVNRKALKTHSWAAQRCRAASVCSQVFRHGDKEPP